MSYQINVFCSKLEINMSKLILISGSINSGKSTTSERLVELLPDTAHVHGDSLRHFVTWLSLEKATPVTLQNLISVSRNFLSASFNVVVDYPFSRADFERVCDELTEFADSVHPFVLSPRLEVAQRRRGERVLSQWEVNRIAYHYSTNLHNPGFGTRIDNSDLTPEETARFILRHITGEL